MNESWYSCSLALADIDMNKMIDHHSVERSKCNA